MNTQTKRLSLLILAAGLATMLLFLAYPRFTSGLSYVRVEAALDRHWKDYPIKQSQFPVLIEIAQNAIHTLDDARYWQGLGWLYYLQANALSLDTPEGRHALRQAQNAFESLLKQAPANPAAWLRLAWIHALQKHPAAEVTTTLNMSFYTGRAERYLIMNRLDLALRYANDFKADELSIVRDQIQLAWRFYPQETLELIRSGDYMQQTLLGLIADSHPALIKQIEEKL